MSNSNQPTYYAYNVTKAENMETAKWLRIGAAWSHKNGEGLSLQLDCMPLDGRIVLRTPKEQPTTKVEAF